MASDYIKDFLDATKHLKDAADQLKKSSGGKPIGQSLNEAVKTMLAPAVANDHAGRRTISEMYGFDPKPYRDGKTPGAPPQPPDNFKNAQFDMIRKLIERSNAGPLSEGKSDPTKMLTKPSRIYRQLRIGAKKGLAIAKKSWIGKLGAKAVNTKVGRAIGRGAARVGAIAASRLGITAAGAVAAGTAVTAGAAITAGVAIAAAALVVFGKVVVAAADKQLEAMRQYEKVSAGMAAVFAQADLRDTLRNIERGERLAPSAQALSNADQKLKDNSSEIVILVERIQNNVMGFLEDKVGAVLGPINAAAKALNKAFGGDEEDTKFEAFSDFLDRVHRDSQNALAAGDRWHRAAANDRR